VRQGCQIAGKERSQVIPNFINDLPDPPANADALDQVLPDEPFILFFGDATIDKGAQHLAAVHAQIPNAPPLVFAGRCFVNDLKTMSGVRLTGPLPRELMIETVRRCAFAVVPSLWAEPFGMVALEAAAVGRAVVASGVGGLTQIVRDQSTGLLVPPGDAPALDAALRRLIDDPALRDRMGRAGADHARSFTAEAIVPRFEAVYREALAARARSHLATAA
jgi:glycosyltransferase involved in cell wall biosynthesis